MFFHCKRIALLIALWMVSPLVAQTGKPNVLIVLSDDQGYGDLSCHGNPDESQAITPSDKEVVFLVRLAKSKKIQMQSWFLDQDGKKISGAYFAYVNRKQLQ